MRKLFLLLGVLLLFSLLNADVVKRKDGTEVKGKVVAEDDEFVSVATRHGIIRIPRSEIAEVVKEPSLKERYEKHLKETPKDDAQKQYELGVWCKENGLKAEARYHFLKAIEVDPDCGGARRELGYIFYAGRWIHENELKAMLEGTDLVVHDGRVMRKEEHEELMKEATLPEEEPEEEVKEGEPEEEPTGEKEEGVDWTKAKTSTAGIFKLKTNCGRKTATRYRKFLAAMSSHYRSLFGSMRKDAKKLPPPEVWIYRNGTEYSQFTGRPLSPGVYYDSASSRVTTFDGAGAESGGTEASLGRYCAYLYLERVMLDAQGAPPWIVEGYAGYCEAVEVSKSGRVKLGIIPRNAFIKVKTALNTGKLPAVVDLVRMPRSRFGENERAFAWSLLHFMLKKKYSKALKNYFLFVSNQTFRRRPGRPRTRPGVPHTQKFAELVGNVDTLNAAWRAWIAKTETPVEGKISDDEFTSERYGISIRKPSSHSFVKEAAQPGFLIGATLNDSSIYLLVYSNPQKLDAKTYADNQMRRLKRNYGNILTGEVSAKNIKGVYLSYKDSERRGKPSSNAPLMFHYSAVFATEKYIFVINCSCYEANQKKFENDYAGTVSSLKVEK